MLDHNFEMMSLLSNFGKRRFIAYLTITVCMCGLSMSSCSSGDSDEQVGPEPTDTSDVSAGDTRDMDSDTTHDSHSTETTESTSGDAEETATKCDIEVELTAGVSEANTSKTDVSPSAEPTFCWQINGDLDAPGQEGWLVRVVREENAGGGPSAWRITGLSAQIRAIEYGNCELASNSCSTAQSLRAGTYFVQVWDFGDSERLGGTTVFRVE